MWVRVELKQLETRYYRLTLFSYCISLLSRLLNLQTLNCYFGTLLRVFDQQWNVSDPRPKEKKKKLPMDNYSQKIDLFYTESRTCECFFSF